MEPPGRWNRLQEPLLTSIDQLVASVARDIRPYLDKPFALMGYSLGALVAYELARHLRRVLQRQPGYLFVAARRAPHLVPPTQHPPLHDLQDMKLVAALVANYDGLPRAVVEDPELLAIVLPIARADLRALETYAYVPESPLSCPIAVWGGETDRATPRGDLDAWRVHTTARFSLQMFSGGHFFIDGAHKLLVRAVEESLVAVERSAWHVAHLAPPAAEPR
jgi:medium-chain acyl-[acyl-carrier-protein] hydrolase